MTRSDRKRLLQSGCASAGIWLVLAILAIVVPMNKPENAKRLPVVHIALAAVPAVPVRDSPKVSAPEGNSGSRGDLPPQRVSKAKNQPAPRSSAVQQEPSGGLGIPNFSKPVAASGSPASAGSTLEFASEKVSPVSSGSGPTVREFEGTAANVEAKGDVGLRGTASGTKAQAGSPSADTSSALAAVSSGAAGSASGSSRSSAASGSARSSAASAGSASSAASSSGVPGISFDGVSRKLVYPASPAIVLPDRLARLVDSDRSVTVRFTVLADGTVPATLVEFTPQAVLPPEIRDWLRKEFSDWRFEKAASDGQAQFLYSIRVK